jgi:hypothetical protein
MSDQSDIARDLQADGQAMTLTRTIDGVFDPVTGTTTAGVIQSWQVYGITKNYKLSSINTANSLILSGDKQGVISATVEILVGDVLTVMDEKWRVISFNDLSPQGEVLMYYPQLRK